MRFDLNLTAYDCLGVVVLSTSVRQTLDTPEARPDTVLHKSTTILGTGEADPTEWARDALVGMLEDL